MTITDTDAHYMECMNMFAEVYERIIFNDIQKHQEIHRRQHVPIASRHVVVNGATVWRVYDGGRK